ncbi:MAG TPA: sodium-dependent transporter, partial [Bacillota bacterium]|nr:sodium-dependent transporter [Bacillota bacterium]
FFLLLFIAALTSSVSLLEVVVAYLIDQHRMERKKAVYLTSAIMAVMCVLSSLSMGVMSGVQIFGVGFFDFFDILTDKIFLAIGGGLLAICVGFFMNKEDLKDELTNGGTLEFGLFELWYNVTKYVIPVVIAWIAFAGITAIAQKGLMIFGVLVIVVLAIFSKKL